MKRRAISYVVAFGMPLVLAGVLALIVVPLAGLISQPDPFAAFPTPMPVLETMPDARSMVTIEVDEDGIARFFVRTWLAPDCVKTYILRLDGRDILRCTAQLPRDELFVAGTRYEHRSSCILPQLAPGRLQLEQAEVFVEERCEGDESGGPQWDRKPANRPGVGDATSRSSSC